MRCRFALSKTTACACGPSCRSVVGPDPSSTRTTDGAAKPAVGANRKDGDWCRCCSWRRPGSGRWRRWRDGTGPRHGTAAELSADRRPVAESISKAVTDPGLAGAVVRLVDGVQKPAVRVKGEEARARRAGQQGTERAQRAGRGVEAKRVDPLALRPRVGAHPHQPARCGGKVDAEQEQADAQRHACPEGDSHHTLSIPRTTRGRLAIPDRSTASSGRGCRCP